jgi:hypothetical protein
MQESWISRHGTTLIAFGAALVLGIVALVLWRPGWHTARPPAVVDSPSNPGWKIRYNATIALARRGNPDTSVDLLKEMLDVDKQRANFSVKQEDEKVVVDEQQVDSMLAATLDAVELFLDKRKDPKADADLKPAVEKLTENQNPAVREKAKDVLKKLS